MNITVVVCTLAVFPAEMWSLTDLAVVLRSLAELTVVVWSLADIIV